MDEVCAGSHRLEIKDLLIPAKTSKTDVSPSNLQEFRCITR